MAPFKRGGQGDVLDDWLAFHDETDHFRSLYKTRLVFTRGEGGGIWIDGTPDVYGLDIRAVEAEMADRGFRRWRSVSTISSRTSTLLPAASRPASSSVP